MTIECLTQEKYSRSLGSCDPNPCSPDLCGPDFGGGCMPDCEPREDGWA